MRHIITLLSADGDGAVVPYVNTIRTTKETVVQIVNDRQGADDMCDHDESTSYSHWGMKAKRKGARND
jgi:hypothetical protein